MDRQRDATLGVSHGQLEVLRETTRLRKHDHLICPLSGEEQSSEGLGAWRWRDEGRGGWRSGQMDGWRDRAERQKERGLQRRSEEF